VTTRPFRASRSTPVALERSPTSLRVRIGRSIAAGVVRPAGADGRAILLGRAWCCQAPRRTPSRAPYEYHRGAVCFSRVGSAFRIARTPHSRAPRNRRLPFGPVVRLSRRPNLAETPRPARLSRRSLKSDFGDRLGCACPQAASPALRCRSWLILHAGGALSLQLLGCAGHILEATEARRPRRSSDCLVCDQEALRKLAQRSRKRSCPDLIFARACVAPGYRDQPGYRGQP
jgi:hypothetical protein